MEFLKVFLKNKRLAWQLGKNDFKNRFANTSLGSIWGFLQPFVFMMMYVIVFQYIFVTPGPDGAPYVVWFMPGMAMWMCINDGIIGASSSIRGYSYLVKKVVFNISVLPVVKIISAMFVHAFFVLFTIVLYAAYGKFPDLYYLQINVLYHIER